MSSPRFLAMCGPLQISPHPRGCYDSETGSASAMGDKRRWDKAHPDKPATIVEVTVEDKARSA